MQQLLFAICFLVLCLETSIVHAASEVDSFYRPLKASDLAVKLPPRIDADDTASESASSIDSGCPDSISIGSVPDGTTVYGDVDIEVVITEDIYIRCGGL